MNWYWNDIRGKGFQSFDGRFDGKVAIVTGAASGLGRAVAQRLASEGAVVACLDRIVARRGAHPELVRSDNGPELTANALRDWCRFGGAGTSYIDPGSPWQNPWVESYASRMRDELLAIEQFDTILEAEVLVADWREEYNENRPHSALGMLSPAAFSRQWRTNHQPLLS